MFSEFAPAKINLTLRVLARRADGFHELSSLVAFADIGDQVSFTPSDHPGGDLRLDYAGRFGATLQTSLVGEDGVLAAARFADPDASGVLCLEKNLPIMAGMGGGSADAAAVLRLFKRSGGGVSGRETAQLGSDVPVCLLSRAAWMSGRGEQVSGLASFPECPAVLVNTGIAMPTGPVFEALGRNNEYAADEQAVPDGFADLNTLFAYIRRHGNDLLAPALSLAPEIGPLLDHISATGADISAMSGSGATCFGLYKTQEQAEQAAADLKNIYPDGFVHAALLS